ncbi:creatininase family protein [Candidatus Latescibacterota bacterium]
MDTNKEFSRRTILKGISGVPVAAAGFSAISPESIIASDNNSAGIPNPKVRYSDLLPHEFRSRLTEKPVAYLPMGTIEWHGEHLPLGSDAIQSEELMIECAAQFGGIVMPPIHLGPDRSKLMKDGSQLIGMDYAESTVPPHQLAGSCYWISGGLFNTMIDAILAQLKRSGFTAVFADGHGPSRWSWVEGLKEREARFGMKLLGVTSDIGKEWKSQVDHAARNESSLMLHYKPGLVDMSQLPGDRAVWPQGVGGEDPRDSSADYGKECFLKSVDLVKKLLIDAEIL